jgi:hypothetical protein
VKKTPESVGIHPLPNSISPNNEKTYLTRTRCFGRLVRHFPSGDDRFLGFQQRLRFHELAPADADHPHRDQRHRDPNGKGGVAFDGTANGLGAVTAGSAMAWDDVAKSGENDAEFFIAFSTAGFTNLVVSFDIKGTLIESFDLKYSLSSLIDVTNPTDVIGTIKAFDGSQQDFLNDQAVSHRCG